MALTQHLGQSVVSVGGILYNTCLTLPIRGFGLCLWASALASPSVLTFRRPFGAEKALNFWTLGAVKLCLLDEFWNAKYRAKCGGEKVIQWEQLLVRPNAYGLPTAHTEHLTGERVTTWHAYGLRTAHTEHLTGEPGTPWHAYGLRTAHTEHLTGERGTTWHAYGLPTAHTAPSTGANCTPVGKIRVKPGPIASSYSRYSKKCTKLTRCFSELPSAIAIECDLVATQPAEKQCAYRPESRAHSRNLPMGPVF
jgi:hypothetical protein